MESQLTATDFNFLSDKKRADMTPSTASFDIALTGCTPVPLSNYLKALGVLRIVAEQKDPAARGWWHNDVFHVRSTLDRNTLLTFLRDEYRPSPIVGPWGARSGFFAAASEKAAREALEKIAATDSDRLAVFREAIKGTRFVLEHLRLMEKADNDDDKLKLMKACRAMLPDELMPWLDAVFVLLSDGRAFPPLLGTGGNEGSGSYMSGFAQQVVAVVLDRLWDHALIPALFAEAASNQSDNQTPGHFSPEAAGGPNAAAGFDGQVGTNCWDYLLTLEGALLFAASSVKRLEDHSDGTLAFPFCVRPSAVGYGSAADADEASRAEMWFPLWTEPTTCRELEALLAEGRAVVNRRHARNGVDFARAVAGLGTDRGIQAFERYGFQQRNGLSNFAIPLGRFFVKHAPEVELLDSIDEWLDQFHSKAGSDKAPASLRRAVHQLEAAIFELCQSKSSATKSGGRRSNPTLRVLIALGAAERAMAASPKFRDSGARPVPLLKAAWIEQCYDGSAEFRLAAALASIGTRSTASIRKHLEPIESEKFAFGRVWWRETSSDPTQVWGAGSLVSNLIAVLNRRMIEAQQAGEKMFEGQHVVSASLTDVAAFIDGSVDDARIEELLWGLMLIDWKGCSGIERPVNRRVALDAAYALLKLCHLPHDIPGKSEDHRIDVPLNGAITARAASDDLAEATRLAARRLTASGLPTSIDVVGGHRDRARRIAAALMFPISGDTAAERSQQVQQLCLAVRRLRDDEGHDRDDAVS